MGTTDSGFQHASTPDRNLKFLTEIVNPNRLAMPTDSTSLDIDDATGLHLDRQLGVAAVANGLIQTDRGPQGLLQLGMVKKIVEFERLLEHEQIEFVELLQV